MRRSRADISAEEWEDQQAERGDQLRDQEIDFMMSKRYLENLLHQCSEHRFGQDAIEWAILSGWVKLTHQREQDVSLIMSQYDALVIAYRHQVAQLEPQPILAQAA